MVERGFLAPGSWCGGEYILDVVTEAGYLLRVTLSEEDAIAMAEVLKDGCPPDDRDRGAPWLELTPEEMEVARRLVEASG